MKSSYRYVEGQDKGRLTKLGMIPLPRQLLCYLTLHNFPDVQKNIFIRTLPSFCWIGAPSAAEVGVVSAKVFFSTFFSWLEQQQKLKRQH